MRKSFMPCPLSEFSPSLRRGKSMRQLIGLKFSLRLEHGFIFFRGLRITEGLNLSACFNSNFPHFHCSPSDSFFHNIFLFIEY